ncbi:DNA replication/repair protein RecF [Ahniella affigens]|uniref:DNA replication and repair protein RecF n=2 Tax=Ahniella affigens TaxID=2021234 RepID=A0A2P1PZG4_9GAMM|nr:DNA replication/repair protein RecF [Ahniella affigens]
MKIERLQIGDLRNIGSASVALGAGVNGFVGPNGAGKTSVLEAVYLLGYGHSFRKGGRDVIVRDGCTTATVFAEIAVDQGRGHRRIGIARARDGWHGKVDGEELGTLSELFRLAPVCCFEPGSHHLMTGAAEERRALLDWGLFHVEHNFLDCWRRYQRGLKQRNALIRTQGVDTWFEPWEREMADAAQKFEEMRDRYIGWIGPIAEEVGAALCPELGAAAINYKNGWRELDLSTPDGRAGWWARERAQDRDRGYTRRGPHRADWRLGFSELGQPDHYSRGQAKLAALCLMLAQVLVHREKLGAPPIVLLDDLASELDAQHQGRLMGFLRQLDAQVLVTGTHHLDADRLFHVEHGNVIPGPTEP